jgi:hypothetical protein
MIRKDAVGLQFFGHGATLLMAQHNGIIVTRMELGMTTGVNRKHFVCVCARACCTAHDDISLVLHYHVPQLAYVIIHKQYLFPSN